MIEAKTNGFMSAVEAGPRDRAVSRYQLLRYLESCDPAALCPQMRGLDARRVATLMVSVRRLRPWHSANTRLIAYSLRTTKLQSDTCAGVKRCRSGMTKACHMTESSTNRQHPPQ